MLENLKPKAIWKYFEEISSIPRPSKKEEKIREYLVQFAKQHQLEAKVDEIGNVLIKKPASGFCTEAPSIILQSHMDMVCEKKADKDFNFDTDGIRLVLDGEWLKADGTTLGADNGIGMAAQLAVLADKNIEHGPIECLFTVDEETGLSGAFALKEDFFDSRILLNLDSEDDGEIFIGCAGGIDTTASLPIEYVDAPKNHFAMQVSVQGLLGGHSGDDINKGRANAIKILVRFLRLVSDSIDIRISKIEGGNLRNAIAREAKAQILVPMAQKEMLVAEMNIFAADIANEYQFTDSEINIIADSCKEPQYVFAPSSQQKLINLLLACPHGVLEMSSRMEGMVETSTNLASVKINNEELLITTSQRSEIESRKNYAAQVVRASLEQAGANAKHSEGYPGWEPNPNSYIAGVASDSYQKLFGNAPKVKSIHAGLECGLFLQKYPDLDMVSIGPTIRNAHSPDERIHIQHTEKFWLHLLDILQRVSKKA